MGKVVFEINESAFSKKHTQQYELSILTGVDSLCYSIADARQQLLVLRRFTPAPGETVNHVYQSDPLLQRPYARVKIALAHHQACLVPNRLYREAEKETYLAGLVDISPEESVRTDELSIVDSMVVYTHHPNQTAQASVNFPGATFYHLLTPLLKTFTLVAERFSDSTLFVNCRTDSLQIALFQHNDLLFYNSFSYQSSSDFVYYVLLVCNQFNLDPNQLPLYYCGSLLEDSEIYRLLFRYIRQVRTLPTVDLLQLGPQASQSLFYNQYIDLFSLALCK